MKIYDQNHTVELASWRYKTTTFNLRVYQHRAQNVVIVTEAICKDGDYVDHVSTTNSIEYIARYIREELGFYFDAFISHLPNRGPNLQTQLQNDFFAPEWAMVYMKFDPLRLTYSLPEWKHFNEDALTQMIGCAFDPVPYWREKVSNGNGF